MKVFARSSSAAVLAVVLMSAAGCSLLDRGTAEEGSAKGGAPGASPRSCSAWRSPSRARPG